MLRLLHSLWTESLQGEEIFWTKGEILLDVEETDIKREQYEVIESHFPAKSSLVYIAK